ncbi:NAD-dependent epimerase/dehydratase family protein [Sabulilitoribacter multivorans]|uniref:NAD-dependent epimerase/dehydratase family protein n=1 Tax=Flaviramulus multivorans TaxID=1304750 RepID=A0ABS9IK84_9FLAO|nr:NAD-dependent epimerase/dehydratase family protein [Flaviramulus multivorans]MCF7560982.1 NAD-dependent epimerase/dehydratase family protein [Flaviramulus multivorans]
MKVFVTGATGYVGHQLALKLANENYTVIALVRNLNSDKIPSHNNIIPVKGDICDYESVEKGIEGCDYVFHAAAYTNLKCKKLDNFYDANVLGTENILKASLKHQIKKVIYTSTLAVHGPSYKRIPITENQPRLISFSNDYELTKGISEELVFTYIKKGLPCAILNVSRVYGPGLKTFTSGVNTLISKIAKNDFLVVPSKLDITTNYVFIDDVVNAHILAMKKVNSTGKYIIGGENASYETLFGAIKSITKSKIKIVKVNYGLIKMSFSFVNLLKRLLGVQSGITLKVLDTLFVNRVASSEKALNDLGYQVTSLNRGLTTTINHLKI